MKNIKSFISLEMLEEGLKLFKLFFFMFSSRKEGDKYVQNILLAPLDGHMYSTLLSSTQKLPSIFLP